MRDLELWGLYTREDVHNLFSPNTKYTPGSGGWGISGIMKIPETEGSFVFMVTIGTRIGGHDFEESITDEGVLSWQSQPNQKLTFPVIRRLIDHDDLTDTIHLFLRLDNKSAYRYCGELAYVEHDEQREQPVYFKWQLLSWPPRDDVLAELDPIIESDSGASSTEAARAPTPNASGGLTQTTAPKGSKPGGSPTRKFKAKALALHPDQDARNKKLGLAGELLVLNHERQRLIHAGQTDLADQVIHVSVTQGDGAGYDILSFAPDGTHRHIEVKTTRSGANAGFFASPNEVAFSEQNPDTFVLVRVYKYDQASNSAQFYEQPGPLTKQFILAPSQFRVSLQP